MFERFTNRARSVLVTAQDEARGLGHNFIGTEHLLLGIVAANDDVVVQALQGYDFTLDDLRTRIRELIGPGGEDITGPPPFTPRSKKVLELSLREAVAMGHDHIDAAHMLLGILREGEGVGSQLLVEQGVDYERTRMWVGSQSGPRTEIKGRRGRRVRGFGRWEAQSEAGTRAVVRVRAKAYTLAADDQLGTHHFLLAMLDEPNSMAAKVLASLGVTKEQVESEIADIGIENTTDAPPRPPVKPTIVSLAEGIEVRISDPDLGKLVETGQLEELLKEIVRRSKPDT